MLSLALDAGTERVAVNLLRHLEWQPSGFSLVFLFADVGPSLQLADWLDERLATQHVALQRCAVPNRFALGHEPEAAVDALIGDLQLLSSRPGAVWLAVHRHPHDERWNEARRRFLARLNERRFLLERDLARPLVLVLPADFRAEARNIAPDIWHVRALSEELRAAGRRVALGAMTEATKGAPAPAVSSAATPAFDEWRRMRTLGSAEHLFLPTAWQAVTELLTAGRFSEALEVARDAVLLASQSVSLRPEALAALLDLSISLNNFGGVAEAQGKWGEAASAYGESLSVARQLVERTGTPESLRDLSVSLDNVGRVAEAQGAWNDAAGAYRESLSLRRQLVSASGTPEAQRDLLVSLASIGRVAEAQGEWSDAANAYREGVSLAQGLVQRLGGTPLSLRDVLRSLHRVGRIAEVQGEWGEAARAYLQALSLSRQLVEQSGATPQSLRDLSISLDNVGRVAQAQGELSETVNVYRESLSIRRRIAELGSTPESLEDLATSLINLAAVDSTQRPLRDEALNIYRSLAERFPQVTRYRELAAALQGESAPPPDNPPEAT